MDMSSLDWYVISFHWSKLGAIYPIFTAVTLRQDLILVALTVDRKEKGIMGDEKQSMLASAGLIPQIMNRVPEIHEMVLFLTIFIIHIQSQFFLKFVYKHLFRIIIDPAPSGSA